MPEASQPDLRRQPADSLSRASCWHPFRMLGEGPFRWCRFAQPPANGCEPSGFGWDQACPWRSRSGLQISGAIHAYALSEGRFIGGNRWLTRPVRAILDRDGPGRFLAPRTRSGPGPSTGREPRGSKKEIPAVSWCNFACTRNNLPGGMNNQIRALLLSAFAGFAAAIAANIFGKIAGWDRDFVSYSALAVQLFVFLSVYYLLLKKCEK